MKNSAVLSYSTPSTVDLESFLADYSVTLRSVFRDRADATRMYVRRGLPPSMMREILAHAPLATFIPSAFGGRGEHIHECLAVVDATAYESLAMALTLGINGALFLQPVAKYGRDQIKAPIFERFLEHQNMGGLMMTEPDFGSDALNMETAFVDAGAGGGYRIQGVKHWGGLTGLADYWLVVARSRNEAGQLARDVDFFVCDTHRPEQAIKVEEQFESLGLLPIPYGRNLIDVRVPEEHRLVPQSTGLKMMLDLLHRSRLQFPGMAMGFLRRVLDEAVDHTQQRQVGGRSLFSYDQVQRRLARLQSAVTACSAMCVYSGENAAVATDLSKEGVYANAIKSVVTDLMHEASQSLLQLFGAKGYRFDHIAGRGLVDSRPFQIFEGSNDILYEQLALAVLKVMRRADHRSLHAFLPTYGPTSRAADVVRSITEFELASDLPQRRVVDLGRALGRIVIMELVIELGERGYAREQVDYCLEDLRVEVAGILGPLRERAVADMTVDGDGAAPWYTYARVEGS